MGGGGQLQTGGSLELGLGDKSRWPRPQQKEQPERRPRQKGRMHLPASQVPRQLPLSPQIHPCFLSQTPHHPPSLSVESQGPAFEEEMPRLFWDASSPTPAPRLPLGCPAVGQEGRVRGLGPAPHRAGGGN